MLSELEQVKGMRRMIRVMSKLKDKYGVEGAGRHFLVSAKVGGNLIISDELIECRFVSQLDQVDIHIYWEEAGYKKYKNLGLHGLMNTKWQDIKIKDGKLFVIGDDFKIRIVL